MASALDSTAPDDSPSPVPTWLVGVLTLPYALYAVLLIVGGVVRVQVARLMTEVVPLVVAQVEAEQPIEAGSGDGHLHATAETLVASLGGLREPALWAAAAGVPLFLLAWWTAGRREWARRGLVLVCALDAVRAAWTAGLLGDRPAAGLADAFDAFLRAVGPLAEQDAEVADQLASVLAGSSSWALLLPPLLLLGLAWTPPLRRGCRAPRATGMAADESATP